MRLWPNGEFGLGVVRKFRPGPLPPKQQESLAISYSWTLSELTTVLHAIEAYGSMSAAMEKLCPEFYAATLEECAALGSSNDPKTHKRAPRGSKGITTYGRRMLRNGLFLLEKWAGKRNIAMVTCTIPSGPPGMEQAITQRWSEITRVFAQWLHRRLSQAGGCPWVLGCTEVQESRQRSRGGLPLHLHLAFQAKAGKRYSVSVCEIREAWERAVTSQIPQAEVLRWDAATRIEKVKKSVVRYLSKYLSKGVSPDVLALQDEGYKIPSAWWIGVGKFKKAIARQMIVTTGEDATLLHDAIYDHPELFRYVGKIYIGEEGEERCVGWYGIVHRDLHRLINQNALVRKSAPVNLTSDRD